MKDRIVKVMEHEELTPSKFAEAIGIQRSAMSHIISGRNNPSLDVLQKILERFMYIAPDWLLFGKGKMFREGVTLEPDLFSNMPVHPARVQVVPEERREKGVEHPKIETKAVENDSVIRVKTESKNVTKIMIFYSDNTYDTFISEKNRKE
ncbi:MAG: helix-turn-helix domain-containing protein [Tannerellaceae bacterium]|jgi:transcriptional regulator with XRE-family HTH domain|nr:helix-turn-helix domain-containing protein [Tannerellaceae bacterium]